MGSFRLQRGCSSDGGHLALKLFFKGRCASFSFVSDLIWLIFYPFNRQAGHVVSGCGAAGIIEMCSSMVMEDRVWEMGLFAGGCALFLSNLHCLVVARNMIENLPRISSIIHLAQSRSSTYRTTGTRTRTGYVAPLLLLSCPSVSCSSSSSSLS